MGKHPKRIDVAGIEFDPITQTELINSIGGHIASRHSRTLTIVKPYVEFFAEAWANKEIMQLINRADCVVADGIAVQWAASYLAGKRGLYHWLHSLVIDIQKPQWRERIIPERGAGVDATHKLFLHARDVGWTVGVFGGPQDTQHTQDALRRLYPKLKLVGVWSGFYKEDEESDIVSKIKEVRPDILFVAQGFPRQEQFIDTHKTSGMAKVMIGEGGTFDFDSMGGNLKRAPQWLRKIGLEWLWRLIQQPKRWRRQVALPRFIWRIYTIGQQK